MSRAEQYLSKENTSCLKGYFALCVLAHHLYQYSGIGRGTITGMCFQMMGYLSVAVFFFFTGYGLMVSANKQNYIAQFPKKRILPFYLFYVLLIIIYGVYRFLLTKQLPIQHIVQSFLWGETIVPLGWYLQTTTIIYVLYWMVWRTVKLNTHRFIAFGVLLCTYCFMCRLLDMPSTWYESVFTVFAGMLWANNKEDIDVRLSDRPVSWIAVIAVLFIGSVLLQKVSYIAIGAKMISAVAFVCLVMMISYCLANSQLINNAAARWLGKFSFGIYVSQGFFLLIQRSNPEFFNSSLIFILVSTLGTLVIGMIMQKTYMFINAKVNSKVM